MWNICTQRFFSYITINNNLFHLSWNLITKMRNGVWLENYNKIIIIRTEKFRLLTLPIGNFLDLKIYHAIFCHQKGKIRISSRCPSGNAENNNIHNKGNWYHVQQRVFIWKKNLILYDLFDVCFTFSSHYGLFAHTPILAPSSLRQKVEQQFPRLPSGWHCNLTFYF